MLWEPMTVVAVVLGSSIGSSMRAAAIGARPQQGASLRSTSGSTAMTPARQSACCGPPARPRALAGVHALAGDGGGPVLERRLVLEIEGQVVDPHQGAFQSRGRLRPGIEVGGDPDVPGHESLLTHGARR